MWNDISYLFNYNIQQSFFRNGIWTIALNVNLTAHNVKITTLEKKSVKESEIIILLGEREDDRVNKL